MTYLTNNISSKSAINTIHKYNIKAHELWEGDWEKIDSFGTIQLEFNSTEHSAKNGLVVYFSNEMGLESITKKYRITYISQEKHKTVSLSKQFPTSGSYVKITYLNNETDAIFSLTVTKLNTLIDSNTSFTNYEYDSFGRQRVVNPYTIIDVKHLNSKNDIMNCEKIIGSAVSTHINKYSCVNMYVSNKNDQIIRQTRRYCTYQPGKSFLIFASGVINNNNGKNTSSCIGFYNNTD